MTLPLLIFLIFFGQEDLSPTDPDVTATATIEVQVKGLANKDGQLIVAIYKDNPPGFPEGEAVFQAIKFHPITALSAKATFKDIPYGRYAVTIFHDEDGDEKMDYNLVGIPKEGYGFSTNFKPKLSAPAFNDVAVEVGQPKVTIPIKVRYGI